MLSPPTRKSRWRCYSHPRCVNYLRPSPARHRLSRLCKSLARSRRRWLPCHRALRPGRPFSQIPSARARRSARSWPIGPAQRAPIWSPTAAKWSGSAPPSSPSSERYGTRCSRVLGETSTWNHCGRFKWPHATQIRSLRRTLPSSTATARAWRAPSAKCCSTWQTRRTYPSSTTRCSGPRGSSSAASFAVTRRAMRATCATSSQPPPSFAT
mmetsp:Transcript_29654/g.95788  ORF Transcript_29654/g.95788 Transcript_29654/m.95788 type:complete len:211 (-) Transcript_29654:1386-2018(-)